MTNQEALNLYQNRTTLKDLKGFKLAKAVILNMKKIEQEVVEVIREVVKDIPEEDREKEVAEILSKDCEVKFITLGEDDIPYDISVEQLALLSYFLPDENL